METYRFIMNYCFYWHVFSGGNKSWITMHLKYLSSLMGAETLGAHKSEGDKFSNGSKYSN